MTASLTADLVTLSKQFLAKNELKFSLHLAKQDENLLDVIDFSLDEALAEVFALKVNAVLANSYLNSLDLNANLLQNAEFKIWANGKLIRTISGIVVELSQTSAAFGKICYQFNIAPKLWLLGLNQNSRIYQGQSVLEIVCSLLDMAQIKYQTLIYDQHQVREYVTQKRESDLDFCLRLLSEEGIIFWFEGEVLCLSDSHLGMTLAPSLIYNPEPQAGTKEYVIDNIKFAAKVTANEVILKDYKHTHPNVYLAGSASSNSSLNGQIFESFGRINDEAQGAQFAKYRLQAKQALQMSGTASSNCALLSPGKLFELSEHPLPQMNARFQVVRIKHYGSLPQTVTAIDHASSSQMALLRNEFEFIKGELDFKSPFKYKPLADGNELATVVGPKDEEIWVNDEGAVKVRFHWQQNEGNANKQTTWLRVAQASSGDGFGFVAIPRIGQEVTLLLARFITVQIICHMICLPTKPKPSSKPKRIKE